MGFNPFENNGYSKRQTDELLSKKADLDENGLIPAYQIPPEAFEYMIDVEDDTARFALTTDDVQKGDIVRVISTGIMYIVIDVTNLDSEAGYKPFAASIAAKAVGDEDGNNIKQTYQTKIDANNKLPADLVDDANSTNKFNMQPDWNQTTNSAGDFIKNKPTLGTVAALDVAVSGNASTSQVVKGDDTRLTDSRNAADVYSWAKASSKPSYTALEVDAIPMSAKGTASGVAELDSNGKVPSSQLPESLALGETSSTAYRGDRGKTAYSHATETRLTTATASGLYKVASTSEGHIASLTNVQKSDITGLGIPAQDTTYEFEGAYNASTNKAATMADIKDGKLTGYEKKIGNVTATDKVLDAIGKLETKTDNIPETAEDLVYNNTVTPVPSTNVQDAIDNIYDLILPILTINITALSSISITDGTTTITGTANVGGKFKTKIPNFGTWTITATLNGQAATEEIIINQIKTYEINMSFPRIYGVSWGFSGKVLSRTDEAALFTDPVPYVNNGVMTAADCSSPFDELGPWSGMTVSVDALGNSLVSIPKFWYKITKTASALTIQIADGPVTGFNVSPAHRARNAQDSDRDIVYIGRYHCNVDYKSKSGVAPKSSITRATARTGVHNLGNEYWQLDISMWITIQMLYIVEFANWDSQAMIGYNCGNSNNKQNTGSTDTMPYHTGTMKTAKTTFGVGVQYRYIEDPWGNVYDWCDGITFNSSNIYCFDNLADYADHSTSTGAKLVGTRPKSSDFIKDWELSSEAGYEWFMYPKEVQSTQTRVPDTCEYDISGTVFCVGGSYTYSSGSGLFHFDGDNLDTTSANSIGVRLQRRPSN